MESTIAKFPRIMVPSTFWSFVVRNGYDEDIIWFKDTYIWVDYSDNTMFIDYLNFMPYERRNDPKHAGRYLRSHKVFIEKSLDKYVSEVGLYQKYEWLANYHNSWCKTMYPEYVDLLIRHDIESRKLGPFR